MKNKSKADRDVSKDELFNDELSSSDYGFIMTNDGDLKAVFVPYDAVEEIPDVIQKVFHLFGIERPLEVKVHTIH